MEGEICRLNADDVLSSKDCILTEYERREILKYRDVFYFGQNAVKKKECKPGIEKHVFFDIMGQYIVNEGDHIAYRYEMKFIISESIRYIVVHARDCSNNMPVAIKIFNYNTRYTKIFVDLEISSIETLKKLNEDECFASIINFVKFRATTCIVLELLGKNLCSIIKGPKVIWDSYETISAVGKTLFTGLRGMHENNLIHFNLKPGKVSRLFKDDSCFKIKDIGWACKTDDPARFQIRQGYHYESPEVLAGNRDVTTAVDIFTAASILYEVRTNKILFKANSELERFQMLVELLGMPPQEFWVGVSEINIRKFVTPDGLPVGYRKIKLGCGKYKIIPNEWFMTGPVGARVIDCEFIGDSAQDAELVDLLWKCLKWLPKDRITAKEALKHNYFRM